MSIDIVIRAKDINGNLIYIISENNNWRFMDKNMQSMALSNYSTNAAELYIALDEVKSKAFAVLVLKNYSNLKDIT